MDVGSVIVNTLVIRLRPWYPIEFQLIADSFVEAKIGKYFLDVDYEDDEPFARIWCTLQGGQTTAQAQNFVNHINGILAGKVRNDAGELVSA